MRLPTMDKSTIPFQLQQNKAVLYTGDCGRRQQQQVSKRLKHSWSAAPHTDSSASRQGFTLWHAWCTDTREIWRDGQAHICFSWSASFYATVGNKPNYWFPVSMLNICHSSTKGQLDRLPPSAPRQAGTWLSKEPKKAYWNIRLPVFPGQIPKSTTGCTSFCFPQMLMKGTWF